ncbi:hypothetical protein DL93DRAFT_2089537 [Clavulina sp. PMI_390]|nr:hypothetical protein DL93DRAFT_2089537 [Clavulina sp. PMI_390]
MLEVTDRNLEDQAFKFIGCSKLSCRWCFLVLQKLAKLQTRGTHGSTTRSQIPDKYVSTIGPALLSILRDYWEAGDFRESRAKHPQSVF